ncbi:MAG: hypothetical protein MI806_26030 [Minwuiales bacterium]|nr:hypothetical protein [Minwuiales bacterium]
MSDISDVVSTLNLAEAAKVVGVAQDTLKSRLADAPPDRNPVLRVGSKGVDYAIDPDRLIAWNEWYEGQVAAAQAARAEKLEQLGLKYAPSAAQEKVDAILADLTDEEKSALFQELCGGLSLAENKTLREVQILQAKLDREQGLSVPTDTVRDCLKVYSAELRKAVLSLEGTVAQHLQLSRDNRAWLRGQLKSCLRSAAEKLRRIDVYADRTGAAGSPDDDSEPVH